jgi:hypothetical protein
VDSASPFLKRGCLCEMNPPSTLTHVTPQGPRTLAELQNLSKRDPESYRSDFLQQWRHYESNLQIFLLKPTDDAKVSEHVVVEDVVVEAVECEEEREVSWRSSQGLDFRRAVQWAT